MAQMSGSDTGGRSFAQLAGYAFGALYLLVGIVGFAVTSGVGFVARDGELLFGLFEINPLHNVVHLLVGVALLWGATRGVNTARAVDTTVGVTYLLVGIVGLFMIDSAANVLAINAADNALHLVSAAVLLIAGLVGAPGATATTARTATRTRTDARSR